MSVAKKKRKAARAKIVAYASTGSHCGPWVRSDESVPGMKGSLAIFETYADARKDAMGSAFVHRCTILVDRDPADPQ
jgi:hypothetical protein